MPKNSQKKWWWRFALLLALVLLLVAGGRLYTYFSDGFSLTNISSDFAYRDEWVEPVTAKSDWSKIATILSQPFHYLGKGAQVYAFLSKDGRYVLKIVKQKHLKIPEWQDFFLRNIPLNSLREYRLKKLQQRRQKTERYLSSSKISYEELRAETALIYVHFNRTNHMLGTTTIVDKLGISHQLNMDDQEFLLQEKAEMMKPTIEGFMQKGDLQGAKNALQSIIDLLVTLAHKGIVDKDWRVFENIGFLNGKAIFIDVGNFVRVEGAQKPEVYKADILERAEILQEWLQKNYPELAEEFSHQLQAIH